MRTARTRRFVSCEGSSPSLRNIEAQEVSTVRSLTPSSFGDPRIRATFGHQGEDFPFALRQFAQWRGRTPAPHQSGDDRRIEDAFALAHPMHGVDQDGDVRDSLFEQVPEVARLICKQTLGVPRFEVLAEDDNGGLRPPFTDPPAPPSALRRCGWAACECRPPPRRDVPGRQAAATSPHRRPRPPPRRPRR